MKLNERDSGIQTISSMSGERVAMGIAEGMMGHVMDILAGLYTDQEMAVIREYSTNAYDAQIEAGVTRPIEVTTPNALSPFLRIRDFGVGLTVKDIHEIYSQYGASTKRHSNAYNGVLGIGCKSALAYTTQFTVTSVRDGVKVQVAVTREADKSASMTVVDTSSTDEPNGTEVIIPARRVHSMDEKAVSLFRWWPEGSVLVNGRPPARFEGLRITDDIYVIDDYTDYIIMGNVPYPAKLDLEGTLPGDTHIAAFVPIGAVSFPPHREALDVSMQNTKDTIQKVHASFKKELSGAVQREIDKASTAFEALDVLARWTKLIRGTGRRIWNGTRYIYQSAVLDGQFTYQGKAIPTEFSLPRKTDAHGNPRPSSMQPRLNVTPFKNPHNGRGRGVATGVGSVGILEWPTTVWVENFTPDKFTAVHKDKLLKWCEGQGLDGDQVTQFALLPGKAPQGDDARFINPAHVVDYDTVKAIKLSGAAVSSRGRTYGHIPGSYDCIVFSGTSAPEHKKLQGDAIDQNLPIFWVGGNRYEGYRWEKALQVAYPTGWTLVCLPANRIDKFVRIVTGAKKVATAMIDAYEGWLKGLTPLQRKALALRDNGWQGSYDEIDATRVHDPRIREYATIASIPTNDLVTARAGFARVIPIYKLAETAANLGDSHPLEDYPLYSSRSLRTSPDAVYDYLNDAYRRLCLQAECDALRAV